MPSPPFIGLTGGVASGKSTALEAFAAAGASTLSTDAVVHELYEDGELGALLAGRWGSEVAPSGAVDRDAVAARVFGQPQELQWLESVLHPLVGQRISEWREGLAPDVPAAVVEVPLLFEVGMEAAFDATVCVIAGDEVRRRRAVERGTGDLDGRDARQLSEEEKARRATHVIRNDGSRLELERRVASLLEEIAGRRSGQARSS